MINKLEIPKRAFNDCYLPTLYEHSRYLVFYGGAGSGKSVYITQRYLVRLFEQLMCNLLVVRAVGDTNRTSTFALFLQVISRWGITSYFKVNKSELSITCMVTGNSVLFKGLDDTEKLKSITFAKGELTDIWVEEASEISAEEDFNQLDIRLRGGSSRKQIVLSFNPIDINHWLKKRFFDCVSDNVTVLHTTYKDNRFIDDDYQALLESYKTTDPYYYAVYCLGQWGVYGKTIFDKAKVAERLQALTEPLHIGYYMYDYDEVHISNIRWVDDPNGNIKLYSKPKAGYPYVLGGDTAGEGSDYFTGQVIDNISGEQVAVMRGQLDEDLYAQQIYCLGMSYNTALVAIEVNFSTHPVRELERLRYPKLYMREVMDSMLNKLVKAHGYKTTQITRPVMISELITVVREHVDTINDQQTMYEMQTFVRSKKGRPEAQGGAHDDLVLALAIAHQARDQQRTTIELPSLSHGKVCHELSTDRYRGNNLGEGESENVY